MLISTKEDVVVIIYLAFCLDVAKGRMNEAHNELIRDGLLI